MVIDVPTAISLSAVAVAFLTLMVSYRALQQKADVDEQSEQERRLTRLERLVHECEEERSELEAHRVRLEKSNYDLLQRIYRLENNGGKP